MVDSQSDSSTPRQSFVEIRRQGLMTQAMAKGRDNSRCDSCGLFWDSFLRHVPLKDGGWVCLHCLKRPVIRRQYAARLAVNLKGVELETLAAVVSQRPCALGRLCMNLVEGKPARARRRQKYCSEACRGRAEFYRQHPELCPAARMVNVRNTPQKSAKLLRFSAIAEKTGTAGHPGGEMAAAAGK